MRARIARAFVDWLESAGERLLRDRVVVASADTMFGPTQVVDVHDASGAPVRVLEVDGTWQSATYLDDSWCELVFPYHRLFAHAMEAMARQPRRVLMLGGGGYAVPKHLVAHHPEVAQIDVMEIDPAIERIARRHFFVDRLETCFGAESSGRLRLHIADARTWLEENAQRYDAIINDCFFGLEPEMSLVTQEAAELICRHLTGEGLYLTNVVSALRGEESAILRATLSSLRGPFSYLWLYPGSPDDPYARDNIVVIASNARHEFAGAWEHNE